MANHKNTNYQIITGSKQTVPAYSTGTGTIATQNTLVIGTGTAFKEEAEIGGWVYDPAQNEVRKIAEVVDDETITLNQAFTSDLAAGSTLYLIPKSDLKEISWNNTGASTAQIDGVDVAPGEYGGWGKTGYSSSGSPYYIDPVIFDPQTSEFKIVTLK